MINGEITLNIDVEKLQNQVQKEVLAEQKYWRENDAKLRAIEQRVPTYEDFRQIVLASHLKPLDKGETLRDEKGQISTKKVWNSVATDSHVPSQLSNQIATHSHLDYVNIKPKNSLEFVKIWKQLDSNTDSEWNFLTNIGAELMLKIFKPEINGDILGKFLILFEFKVKQNYDMHVTDYIVSLLKVFVTCKRFSLNLMFLKDTELGACKRLFEHLESLDQANSSIELTELKCLKSNYLGWFSVK